MTIRDGTISGLAWPIVFCSGSCFGEDAVWAFRPTREGNTVVLAQRHASRPSRLELLARAEAVQQRWGLPAVKWMRLFKPVRE